MWTLVAAQSGAPENIGRGFVVAFVAVAMLLSLFFFVWLYARQYVKAGPNQALVISGRQRRTESGTVGFRIVKGGAFVLPWIEKWDVLSLEILTIDLKTSELRTATGGPMAAELVAQVKIKGDDASIGHAAERFLSLMRKQMAEIVQQVLEGHLRVVAETLAAEEISRNREAFARHVQEVAESDLANLGLEIVSLAVRDIRDSGCRKA